MTIHSILMCLTDNSTIRVDDGDQQPARTANDERMTMLSICPDHSLPVKLCAKWLLLSMAFAWLVGCAAFKHHDEIVKRGRDPFADQKFSCGEEIPTSRRPAPRGSAQSGSSLAAARASSANPDAAYARATPPSRSPVGTYSTARVRTASADAADGTSSGNDASQAGYAVPESRGTKSANAGGPANWYDSEQ